MLLAAAAPDPAVVAAAVDGVLTVALEEAIAATRSTPDRTFTLEDLYDAVTRVEAAAAAWAPDPYFDGPIARALREYVALHVRRPPARPVITSVF